MIEKNFDRNIAQYITIIELICISIHAVSETLDHPCYALSMLFDNINGVDDGLSLVFSVLVRKDRSWFGFFSIHRSCALESINYNL